MSIPLPPEPIHFLQENFDRYMQVSKEYKHNQGLSQALETMCSMLYSSVY